MNIEYDFIVSQEYPDAKASICQNVMFLASDIMDNEIKKMAASCPKFIGEESPDKFMLVTTIPAILVNGNFEQLEIPERPIKTLNGKVFLLTNAHGYGVMDNEGKYIVSCDKRLNYEDDDIIILCDEDYSYVITSNGLVRTSSERIYALSKGYFIEQLTKDLYLLFNPKGVCIETSINKKVFLEKANNDELMEDATTNNDNLKLFEQLIIKKLKEHPELSNRPETNLKDLVAYANSIGLNFIVLLGNGSIYPVNFQRLIKITQGKKSLWIPDEDEEIKTLSKFVRSRIKEEKNKGESYE